MLENFWDSSDRFGRFEPTNLIQPDDSHPEVSHLEVFPIRRFLMFRLIVWILKTMRIVKLNRSKPDDPMECWRRRSFRAQNSVETLEPKLARKLSIGRKVHNANLTFKLAHWNRKPFKTMFENSEPLGVSRRIIVERLCWALSPTF